MTKIYDVAKERDIRQVVELLRQMDAATVSAVLTTMRQGFAGDVKPERCRMR